MVVQRYVGVAEHDRIDVGESPAEAREAPRRRAGIVNEANRQSVGVDRRHRRQRGPHFAVVDVAVDGDKRPVRLELAQRRQPHHITGVEDQIGGAETLDARLGEAAVPARQVRVRDDGDLQGKLLLF